MKLNYCVNCLLPSTKPNIIFDENGFCQACIYHRSKSNKKFGIDWNEREKDFNKIILWTKSQNASCYDVMVPVSGGKDSITQVHRLLEKDLRILAVNVDYGVKTEIGKYNLERIALMGVNLLIVRPELILHKRLMRIGLEEFGDPDLLSHALLHSYPLHIANQFKIPLSLLGENSAFEYGGKKEIAFSREINRDWFNIYAANNGMTAKIISKKYNIHYKYLWQYDYPDEIDLNPKMKNIFCSSYFNWNSHDNLCIAKNYGFKELDNPREGTYRKFVGLDEQINRLHQYIKVLKFGYGRATDHASEDIRLKKISRDKAKELIKKYDLQPLGKKLSLEICNFLGYSENELLQIIEKYRNPNIWKKKNNGEWFINNHLED